MGILAAMFAGGALLGALAGHILITVGRCIMGTCDCDCDRGWE